MKKIVFVLACMFAAATAGAQQTAMNFNTVACNGNTANLYADLDAGKAVVLFYFMPNCGSCPPPASKIQAMANHINAQYPGMVKGYAFPYNNTTNCTYSNSWVTNNNLTFYTPMDSGATQVAYYGGFGMPTVVLVGGLDHRVMFVTQNFVTSDTTEMRDSILALLGTTAIRKPQPDASFQVFPNPATESVTLHAEIRTAGPASLVLLNAAGQEIVTLWQGTSAAGSFSQTAGLPAVPAGNYLLQLRTPGSHITQPLNIVR